MNPEESIISREYSKKNLGLMLDQHRTYFVKYTADNRQLKEI